MVTNQVVSQNLRLEVGGQQESVDVRGEAAAMINTQEAQIGLTRLEREVHDLPNINRNVTGFASFTPGVQPTFNPRGGSLAIASGSQAGFIASSGGRARATAVQLDYTDVNDWEFGGIALGTSPMIDAVQEFKVLTSNFAAEQGVKSNAQVIIVTKSGSNSVHGTAYDFIQSDKFNARDYFDRTGQPRPIKRNNYGFTGGAPIVPNRTFIFGGWEGTKNRGASMTTVATVPTAAARARVTSPASAQLLNLLPLPTAPTANPDIGTVSSSFSAPQDSWQYILKVDDQLTKNQSLSGRWLQSDNLSILRFPALNTLPGFDSDFHSGAKNLSLSHTWVATPRLLNQLRFAYGRSSGLILNEGGLQSPRINITGLVNFGALNFFPNTRVFNVYQVNDDRHVFEGRAHLQGGNRLPRHPGRFAAVHERLRPLRVPITRHVPFRTGVLLDPALWRTDEEVPHQSLWRLRPGRLARHQQPDVQLRAPLGDSGHDGRRRRADLRARARWERRHRPGGLRSTRGVPCRQSRDSTERQPRLATGRLRLEHERCPDRHPRRVGALLRLVQFHADDVFARRSSPQLQLRARGPARSRA